MVSMVITEPLACGLWLSYRLPSNVAIVVIVVVVVVVVVFQVLQKLPVSIEALKQGNMGKLIKQLSKQETGGQFIT